MQSAKSAQAPLTSVTSAGELNDLIETVTDIALKAGELILHHYHDNIDVQLKPDSTPLTKADTAAHEFIEQALKKLRPQWPILSEESVNFDPSTSATWSRFWLVDPLDGTREFIKHTDEFTVNIALIENDKPVLGVVYAPALKECYGAVSGGGAWCIEAGNARSKIQTRRWSEENLVVVVSRSHPSPAINQFLQKLPWPYTTIAVGSSLKLCWVAKGKADIYPRLGPTSLWDIAAAECVLVEAGGQISNLQNAPLLYKPSAGLLNPFFVVKGDAGIAIDACLEQSIDN